MTHTATSPSKLKARLTKISLFMLGAALVLIIALVTLLIMKSRPFQVVDSDKYQVVYLTTGQAYFGKLQNTAGDFLVIKSPYTVQNITNSDSKEVATSQTTLVPVSKQVYGPEDSIAIKSSQVAFWQNLRDDSKVSQAIKSKE